MSARTPAARPSPRGALRPVRSWGRLTADEHEVIPLHDLADVPAALGAPGPSGLPVGLERSYGDVSLNAGGRLWTMTGLDRFRAFDSAAGLLECEAGVTVDELQADFSRRGWMIPVTPGTRHVTIGGAIANDVHGKNHHVAGTIGAHVRELVLARTDGEVIVCSPSHRPEWFAATIGGMGLTGAILSATIELVRTGGPWIESEDLVFGSIEEFFELSAESAEHEYTVSWVDVTTDGGRRGILTRGSTSQDQSGTPRAEQRLTFPVTPPMSLVNSLSVPVFNRAYYRLGAARARRGPRRVHYAPFFYPLDAIEGWNRMYGPRGFHQYQSVIPPADALEATKEMLGEIARSGLGSFLGVLKTFGDRPSPGLLSFPMPGVTLALDFPERGERTAALFARLDRIVAAAGGRLYAGKDARMPREMFEAGYPELDAFRAFRDPGIDSGLARRLVGWPA